MQISFEGTPDEIIASVKEDCPEVNAVLDRVRVNVPFIKREIARYQAAVLYKLARGYDRPGINILDIGTAWGYSAAVMAEAAPLASITTLNQPKPAEYQQAVVHLAGYPNVVAHQIRSWDYYSRDTSNYSLVLVDGDHGQVERDFVWWTRLVSGGVILFHDYSPNGSGRPCQPVYDALNRWIVELGREDFDVRVVDNTGVGMVGLIKE